MPPTQIMTKTVTRTQIIAATAFLAVSSVAAAGAFKLDKANLISKKFLSPTQPRITAQVPREEPRRVVQNCPPPESMVAWWPGNGNARDVVGGFDGLARGNTSYAEGRDGQAFSLPGGYQSGVAINPGNSSLNPTGNFTVMGWMYASRSGASGESYGGDILSQGGVSGSAGIRLFLGSGTSQFSTLLGSIQPDWIDADGNGIRDHNVSANEWVHIAGVLEGTTMRLYQGGTLVGSYTWPDRTRTPNDSTWSLGNNLNGKLDNVMLFNRALSGTEIRNLSEGNCVPALPPPLTSCTASPSGMVAWWPGEGNAEDVIGNHDGQLTLTMTYGEGKVGQTFWNPIGNNLSSYNRAHVEIPYTSDLALSGEYTVMAWVKATHLGGDTALGRGNNYRLQFGNYPEFRAPFTVTGSAATPYGYRFPEAQWVHVTGVKEPGKTRFYIDGVLSEVVDSGDEPVVGTWPVIIGEIFGTDNSGGVDEAMIFNRALTRNEIRTIVRAGEHGVCRP